MNTKLITLLTAVASAWGCAVGADAEESPEEREWSALRLGGEIAGEDSWHGFNNSMFWIQEVGMDYVVKPLNYVYCSILPKPLINGIDDALGDRITWFSAGAHCGMFYTPEFKQEVLERLNCNSKP